MKTFIFLLLGTIGTVGSFAQNVMMLTHGAANSEAFKKGCPSNAVFSVKSIGASTELPNGYSAPWVVMTDAQYAAHLASAESALDLWDRIVNSRDHRKQRVGELLQERIESGQWEPNRIRLHALESELFGKIMQAFRLNSELLLIVTKAVAGTSATNNLTAPERARVAALRPQLAFAAAPDLTQADRDRVIFITAELAKIERLWKEARALRSNIETNTAYIDPATLGTVNIGE